jgi:DNA-binding transcriptional regulator YhcF (GntR family)
VQIVIENRSGFSLNRKNGIPLYVQIKNQIKKRIQLGYWLPGYKLPTEREFADQLEVSRNTISSAYKELEIEGVLVSQQGKGTFVAGQNPLWTQDEKKSRLLKVIDLAIEEASQLTFGLDEFLATALNRAQEKKEFLEVARLAFISASHEYCKDFLHELQSQKIRIKVEPMLIEQLKQNKSMIREQLSIVELIITPFFYLSEVKQLLTNLNKPIVGIALNLDMEAVVELARIPEKTKVGLVCSSESYANNFREFLARSDIEQFSLSITQAVGEDLIAFLDKIEIIAVSSDRKEDVKNILKNNKPIIELRYRPDLGSVNIIKSAILELQEKL